jgi:PadR family transcriptional regulator PadR
MAKEKPDLVYGTLDMLILKALQHDPKHGLAIADRIQQMSQEILRVEQGSLYPALYRLEAQGWIKAKWGVSDNNRKARYYKLTAVGRKQLAAEQQHWARITDGISRALRKLDFMPRLHAMNLLFGWRLAPRAAALCAN